MNLRVVETKWFIEVWADITPCWLGNAVVELSIFIFKTNSKRKEMGTQIFGRAKHNILVLLMVIVLPLVGQAESTVETKLQPYKELLEQGTWDGQDWSRFEMLPLSRYETFKVAFEHFSDWKGKVVVELGTTRSFVHGGHIGCNTDNPVHWTPNQPENWDWGAGFFTRIAAICLEHLNPVIHTVDLSSQHIQRCKIITQDFSRLLNYHVCTSEKFLNECKFSKGIDLLYLDTGDMTPIEPTALLQLREAMIIVKRNLIAKNGQILIDDVRNQTPYKFGDTSGLGKSKYALPYLLENGFELVMDEYQVLLRKK